ncbi:hypothetical protein ASE36_00375 [Rhizobium sp. Root274]|uniref:ProQ/FINO family protein n=1 Tax=unclassified Rhizobium TaxID=2613769 RepID=UPI0007133D88|nr:MULTISPECIES: ProQ/FinO family protein [unclassified Rhizobium]KQW30794.1 hypothetical protein ASC71_00375 [Rhizobium sp. Root1240]KRD32341.1 hypothetical protein ASE36_00375 [Rhizobium sp. Root274]
MSKNKASKPEIQQVRAALSLAFPECIARKSGKKKPLKIGIRQDLMAAARDHFPTLSRRLIDAFLRDYCGGPNYLKSVIKGAVRVNLQGSFAGFVSADEALFAHECLRRINVREAQIKAKRKNPDIGMQQASLAADQALSRAEVLMRLRAELKRLQSGQEQSAMSDDSYFTSGRKRMRDNEIEAVRAQIKKVERAEEAA